MRWRHLPFYILLIFSLWLLAIRLFDLTIVKGGYYRELSEGNRVKEQVLRAPRGIIYDRHGQVLARNTPVYRWQTADGSWQILSREKALAIEAKGGTEAAQLEIDLAREYPWGGILAHVLGYTGEVTPEEMEMNPPTGGEKWRMGDWVGRTGVEEQSEETLKGIDGKELIETDALGTKIKSLGKIDPKPGRDLTLALDLSLQKVAAEALGEKTGAILVSDPQTGEILTLYSSPSFNPNILTAQILTDPNRPMFDRAISGLYPPGSTFKIVTAATGLETGKINSQTKIEDVGEITIGPYRFPNWYWTQYGRKEGSLDILSAIKRSNDIFFYKVGEWVGIRQLADWAAEFGVGKTLGIDLPGEAAGVMPTPEWRKKVRGEDWFLGDTYHVAIGQGDLQVTPLQMNFWTSVIANGGKLCQPTIIKNEKIKTKNDNEKCKDIGLKKETIDLIREGMREACSPGGTGWPLFEFGVRSSEFGERKIPVACKTGTAEYGDAKGRTHAWFTIFAPVDEPEITVTVLVEGGGEGSNVAAPIAKKILEEWFGR